MDRIYYLVITVPAGTQQSAPYQESIALEDNQLSNIACIVPDGHCGLTGIRLLQSQQQVWPWGNNSYIVANGEKIEIPYEDEITSSGMVAEGYNTDIFDHSFYFRFTITNLPEPGENPEAEVVAPGSQIQSYTPDTDDLDVDDILGEDDDTGEIPPVETTGPIPVVTTTTTPPATTTVTKHKLKGGPVHKEL